MNKKILELEDLAEKVAQIKESGKKVILCHGCFDILHFGHLRHFLEAKKTADFLAVTVTPDEFVDKGPDRPIFTTSLRVELLAGLSAIDFIAINKWDSAVKTLELIKPNFFAKGSEYESKDQTVNLNFNLEKNTLKKIGGEITFTYEETSSSSWIVLFVP